jgi:hypothetical protein
VNRLERTISLGKFGFGSIKQAINHQKTLLRIAAIVAIAIPSSIALGASPSLAAPVPNCLSISTTVSPGRPHSISVTNHCRYTVNFRVVPLEGVTIPPFPQTCYHLAPRQSVRVIVPFDRFILERC